MKQIVSFKKIQYRAILILFSAFALLAVSCSKSNNTDPKPKVQAIVSDWVKVNPSTHTSSGSVYNTIKNDVRITQDIMEKGRIFAYLYIDRSALPAASSYYRLVAKDVKNGDITFWAAIQPGEIRLTTDAPLTGNKVVYSFCYVLLPEGYELPAGIDTKDIDAMFDHFRIKKI